jgi:hypothetical protein
MQAEAVHDVPVGHALSHVPQCAMFAVVFTHPPADAHHSCPAVGHWHAPALQISPERHGVLQAPQWLVLDEVSTHAPPQ